MNKELKKGIAIGAGNSLAAFGAMNVLCGCSQLVSGNILGGIKLLGAGAVITMGSSLMVTKNVNKESK